VVFPRRQYHHLGKRSCPLRLARAVLGANRGSGGEGTHRRQPARNMNCRAVPCGWTLAKAGENSPPGPSGFNARAGEDEPRVTGSQRLISITHSDSPTGVRTSKPTSGTCAACLCSRESICHQAAEFLVLRDLDQALGHLGAQAFALPLVGHHDRKLTSVVVCSLLSRATPTISDLPSPSLRSATSAISRS